MSADLLSVTVRVMNTFACAHLASQSPIAEQDNFRLPRRNYSSDYPDGTGISIALLEQMTWRRVWDRLMDKVRQYVETPEGKAAVESAANRRLTENPPHN